jgi:hypothetical protein
VSPVRVHLIGLSLISKWAGFLRWDPRERDYVDKWNNLPKGWRGSPSKWKIVGSRHSVPFRLLPVAVTQSVHLLATGYATWLRSPARTESLRRSIQTGCANSPACECLPEWQWPAVQMTTRPPPPLPWFTMYTAITANVSRSDSDLQCRWPLARHPHCRDSRCTQL